MFGNEEYVVLQVYQGDHVEDVIPAGSVEEAFKFMDDAATDSFGNGDLMTFALYKRVPLTASVIHMISPETE